MKMKAFAGLVPACMGTALVLAISAWADPPTAEEVLDRAAKTAYGDKFDGLKSYRAEGTFAMPAQGVRGTLTIFAKAPDKQYTRIEIPGFGTVEEGFDGKTAWARDPMSGLREKTGAEQALSRYSADFYGDAHWRKRYKKVTLRGEETVDGRKAWALTLEVEGLEPITNMFDAESGLSCRQKMTVDAPQGKMAADLKLSDYRAIEGADFGKILMAHKNVQSVAMQTQEVTLTQVVPNVEIDDARFAMPTESAPDEPDGGAEIMLPSPPLEGAKEGDWWILRILDPGSSPGSLTELHSLMRVEKVEADAVSIVASPLPPMGAKPSVARRVSRKSLSTLRGFVGFLFDKDHTAAPYQDQRIEDGKCTVGGKQFACQKASARIGDGGESAKIEAWFAPDASVLRFVQLIASEDNQTMTIELAGFGSGAETLWGKSAVDFAEDPKK